MIFEVTRFLLGIRKVVSKRGIGEEENKSEKLVTKIMYSSLRESHMPPLHFCFSEVRGARLLRFAISEDLLVTCYTLPFQSWLGRQHP
jgi:hypothetical protein